MGRRRHSATAPCPCSCPEHLLGVPPTSGSRRSCLRLLPLHFLHQCQDVTPSCWVLDCESHGQALRGSLGPINSRTKTWVQAFLVPLLASFGRCDLGAAGEGQGFPPLLNWQRSASAGGGRCQVPAGRDGGAFAHGSPRSSKTRAHAGGNADHQHPPSDHLNSGCSAWAVLQGEPVGAALHLSTLKHMCVCVWLGGWVPRGAATKLTAPKTVGPRRPGDPGDSGQVEAESSSRVRTVSWLQVGRGIGTRNGTGDGVMAAACTQLLGGH